MNEFYGLIYDTTQSCFREDRVEGIKEIINVSHYLAELTKSDEEPFIEPITTLEEAMNFLELYDYEIIEVSKDDFEIFGELVGKNEALNNRLSYELEQEFYDLAKDYKHEPFHLK